MFKFFVCDDIKHELIRIRWSVSDKFRFTMRVLSGYRKPSAVGDMNEVCYSALSVMVLVFTCAAAHTHTYMVTAQLLNFLLWVQYLIVVLKPFQLYLFQR